MKAGGKMVRKGRQRLRSTQGPEAAGAAREQRGDADATVESQWRKGAATLLSRLETAGYFALYSLLGDGNFRPYDWEKMAPALSGDTALLWRFFLVGGRLAPAKAIELLGTPALDFLRRHKLCHKVEGEWTLGAVSLVTFRGLKFFIERSHLPAGYFGEDTKALMALTPRIGKGKCLCLYPGSGAGGLPVAAGSEVETTFALGRYRRPLIQANLVLNSARCEPRFLRSARGDGTSRYEVIVAAPPSVFEPPEVRMPPLIAGGPDGRKWVRQVLAVAEQNLAEDGSLVMTFMFFGEADSEAAKRSLATFLDESPLNYRVTICSKHLMQPGIPLFNMMFSSAATIGQTPPEALMQKLIEHMKTLKFEATYLLRACFTRPHGGRVCAMVDFSDLYYGAWTF